MRKIVKGRVYDTNTAALLGTWPDRRARQGSGEYEALFQTPSDRFFLYKKDGNAMSDGDGNNDPFSEGEIIPLYEKRDITDWMLKRGLLKKCSQQRLENEGR